MSKLSFFWRDCSYVAKGKIKSVILTKGSEIRKEISVHKKPAQIDDFEIIDIYDF